MAREGRDTTDPLARDIERALSAGEYADEGMGFSFAVELGMAAERIGALAAADPARAARLLETFIDGCLLKAGEVGDSRGGFDRFVQQLAVGWIKARQAAGTGPRQTVRRLLRWIEHDPHTVFYRFEHEALEVLDPAGLAELVEQARARFDEAAKLGSSGRRKHGGSQDYDRSKWGNLLRMLHTARQDVDAYISLARETGVTPPDCLQIAQLLKGSGRHDEALEWVERGVGLGSDTFERYAARQDLARLKRDLLVELGRGKEALASAWSEYRGGPTRDRYDELMRFVPSAGRNVWHLKAIDADRGAPLEDRVELLIATDETDRLAELVRGTADDRLEDLSHVVAGPAAAALEQAHPDMAARLWRAQGMRIVNAGMSLYYGNAVLDFENARRCFERGGAADEWSQTVAWVRERHRRKRSFMPAFEAMVAASRSRRRRGS